MRKAVKAPLLIISSVLLSAAPVNADELNTVVEQTIIDDIRLEGYSKKSYQVVLENNDQLYHQPYAFRGSKIQMKLRVELFHNENNGKKAARVITLGNGFVPGKSGVRQTYDSPLRARFTQTYPVNFSYGIYQAGGTPIFGDDYSPQNETADVSVSSTTVSPTIGLSVSGSSGESGFTPSVGLNISSQLGVAYTTRFSSKDYVTSVVPRVGGQRGTGVNWTTSLSQLYTHDYQYYGKWAGVYHYTDCYNENLIPEENFPRLIYAYKPKFQFVFTPEELSDNDGRTEMVVRAGMKEVEEGFTRGACTWSDYGTKTQHTEAQVRFVIDWDKLTVGTL
ncbi:hemolysin [Photobacterium alginatilyticum]|uniref:Hemolysin n=1 Tax=Photobacterium alginatilyticum TaxID=1775171 RepID=A0ABW9YQE9_9GAMM|nr:hemolysin [Photobacterium alginatilyticum]NBI55985.1 hemolysin [Photobacterium alginatilyticum]